MEIIKREIESVAFYACIDPAWAGVRHGFSTRLGGVSPAPWDSLNLRPGMGDGREAMLENYRRFCAAIGVDPEVAAEDACRIEHVISAETFSALRRYAEKHGQ